MSNKEIDELTHFQNVEPEEIYVTVGEDYECTNKKCISEIESLSKQISDLEKEIIKAKSEYHESLVLNLKKDFKIQDLEEKLKKSPYDLFRNEFNEEVLGILTSMSDSKDQDTAFIRIAMTHLYRDNLSKLKGKTYSGRTKEALTPCKKELLKRLFSKRVEHLEDKKEQADRNNCFGKIVKQSIESINKLNSE